MTDRFASQKEALKTQLDRYRDVPGLPCRPVGIILKYPVFSDLTPDQLNYYLYWRSTLGTPEFRKAADGYTWLLVTEIINDPDTEKASEMMNTLCTSRAPNGSPLYPELLSVGFEYSQRFNTMMPPYSEWMATVDPEFLPRALTYLVSYIPVDFISTYVPEISDEEDPESIAERMCELLRSYDRYLVNKTGCNLIRTFMHSTKSCILPFRDYAYLGKKVPLEIVSYRSTGDMISKLFKTMYAICTGKWKKTETPNIPFEENIASPRIRKEDAPEYLSNPNLKLTTVLVRPLGSDPTALGPSCFSDPTAAPNGAHRNTLGDLLTFSKIHPESENAKYVTSDCEHPCFLDLTQEQFDYYVHWKQSFMRGVPLDTDNGYLNLFLSELINLDTPFTPSILQRLMETYGGAGKNLIASVLIDYELLEGHSFSDHRVYLDRYVVNSWIEEFIKGTNKVPLDSTLLGIMRSGGMNVRYISEDIPVQTLSQALQEVFKEVIKDTSPEKMFNAKSVSTWRTLFVGLDYLRGRAEAKVRYTNYLEAPKFVNFIDKSVRYMSALLSGKSFDDLGMKKTFTFLGVDCAKIFKSVITQKAELPEPKPQTKIVLNRDAISEAQSDLAAVTDMMYVPEEEKTTPEVRPEPAVHTETYLSPDDPWKALNDVLDPSEKEYLDALLQSPRQAKELLKKTGASRTKIEDSINDKSLDCIGDTIIENGTIVDDYLNDIRNMRQ